MKLVSSIKKRIPLKYKVLVKKPFEKIFGLKKVHFLHIGKTGGSAIKHAILPYFRTKKYEIVLESHHVKLTDIPVGEKIVFFLRNPVPRFVSGFYSRKRCGKPLVYSKWSVDEKIAFENFETPNELALAISSSDFELREKAVHAMQSIEHVRTSFLDWFKSEANFLERKSDFLFIGFQETLDEDFERLRAILNLPEEASLPTSDVDAHRTPDHFDVTLDEKAVENLEKWYARDIDFIGLCKSLFNGPARPA